MQSMVVVAFSRKDGFRSHRLGASLVFVLGGASAASLIVLGLLHPAIRAVD
jgi:hypothetical protein